jgi:fucose permease
MSMRYLGTICFFFYVGFIIGASSVMVSWLMAYGAAAKLRASCECAHMTVLLVGCWYQGLWS